MERDKRGRFVKKAAAGEVLIKNPLLPESLNSTSSFLGNYSLGASNSQYSLNGAQPIEDPLKLNTKIKVGRYSDGKLYNQFGREITPEEFATGKYQLSSDLGPLQIGDTQIFQSNVEKSNGFNIYDDEQNNIKSTINKQGLLNKDNLANILEFTGSAIAASVNNKIADRALEAEKPFLQDISESHRSVYGDYRAQVEGEKVAAKLRNAASQPLTSDGALQQQTMMNAQIKGQEYIDKGNAQDEALIKQTRETAWQQEKENQEQRQSVAMQNKQAMLMTEKNKAQIESIRDSNNFSQVVAPFISNRIQDLRAKSAEQKYYQDVYDNALVDNEVWSDTSDLSPEELELQKIFLTRGEDGVTSYINGDKTKEQTWLNLSQRKENAIFRKRAELRGVQLNPQLSTISAANSSYGIFGNSNPNYFQYHKTGGTIYKARLVKRTRDNDRHAKNVESNRKIAAKFLEKAIDSLYTYKDVEIIAKPTKNKKRKYQAGGGLPFVGFSASLATSERGATTKKKESSEDNDLTTKDILELLKDLNGLPSDIDSIESYLKNFVISSTSDPFGLESSSSIASRYMNVLSKIKKAKANKEWFDKAYDKLRDNDALDEYAINNEGKFIGINVNTGDYKWFSPQQIESGEAYEYQLLTNSNLLDIRARDKNTAFNSTLIQEAANGVSMQQINDHISKIIQNLGSDKTQTQVFGDQSKEVLNGLKQLQIAAQEVGQDLSISQLYEASVFTENQANQAKSALSYIYSTLPKNMKSLLFIKAGSTEGAEELINQLVNSKLSSTNKLEFSPKNKKGSGSSNSKTGNVTIDGLELSPAQMLQQGFGEREVITIQDSSSTGLQVNAITMPVTTKGNEPLGAATLEDVATSQYGGILNFTNASMGGQIIPFEGRRNIAVDGSKIYSMYLPIDQDAFIKGDIIPDISLIDKVNEVNKVIKERQLTTPQEINAVYEEAGLPVYLNDNGTVVPGFYRRFGVLNGTAIDNAFGKTFVESKYLKKTDDENIINNAISIMNQGRSKEDRIEYDSKNFFNFGGLLGEYDTIYQGTIFIPMSNDVFLGIAGSGKTVTSTEANDLEAQQQQQEKITTYRNPGQLQ